MPVPAEYVAHMGQLGSLVPPDHTFPTPHFYFYTKNPYDTSDIEAPVYSPADLRLTSVSLRHYDALRGGTPNYTDYQLTFSVCADVDIYFIHVRSITFKPIVDLIEAQKSRCRWNQDGGTNTGGGSNEQSCNLEVPRDSVITMAAGDPLGTTGDKQGVGGLDMGMRDYRVNNGRDFINVQHHCPGTGNEHNVYARCSAVCPLDYVSSTERAKYIDLFSDGMGRAATTEPKCGTVHWDIPKTAQGYWFTTNPAYANRHEEFDLFMAKSPLDASIEVFSMGRSVPNLEGRIYAFTPKTSGLTNRRFAEITDAQTYCYDGLNNGDPQRAPPSSFVLVVQLVNDTTLKVEMQSRSTCGNGAFSFTGNEGSFTR